MNISRDTRIDRRRRVLRDASLNELEQETNERSESRSRSSRNIPEDVHPSELVPGKRSAGYSQDVRRACGTRLVQYIPVRPVSFLAVIVLSLLVAGFLLTAHYLIYVNGKLPWYGHPLAVAFDATHPQSIAAWLGSHLWLLCLISTILTFQLRRHKLDDYTGEYRLWFWIVFTCLLASIDSTTHLSELLGLSLDRWSQLTIGWSGKALVQATLAVLIGVLGIRLCSELKSVPLSLVCWLLGLALWAGGAALAQEKFRIDISLQMRYWLRAAFWLGGLTLIWIASLAYLRQVYMEAQRRFLLRNRRLAQSSRRPIVHRLKQSLAFNPLKIFGAAKNQESAEEPSSASIRRRTKSIPTTDSLTTSPEVRKLSTARTEPTEANTQKQAVQDSEVKKRWNLKIWPFTGMADDEAPEFQKRQVSEVTLALQANNSPRRTASKDVHEQDQAVKEAVKPERQAQQAEKQAAKDAATESKRLEKQALQAEREAKRLAARQAKLERKRSGQGWRWSKLFPLAAVGTAFRKLKMPTLSGFKLMPPESSTQSDAQSPATKLKPSVLPNSQPQQPHSSQSNSSQGPRPVSNDRPLPGTVRNNSSEDDELQDDERGLNRAERKKLRRHGRAA